MRNKALKHLTWSRELATQFWKDLAGSEFGEQIAFARFAAPFLVDIVEPYLDRSRPVLDYGGGDNLFLVRELLRREYLVAAFEPNSDIKLRNKDLLSLGNFRGTLDDVPPDSFGTVFLSEVIEHLDDADLAHAMGTVSSSLHPGGVLVLTTPDQENLLLASRYCPQCRQLFHPWGHVRSFDSQKIEALLSQYGFDCLMLRSVDFSDARKESLRLESMAEEIRGVASRLRALASKKESGRVPVQVELREAAATLERISGDPPTGDPARRKIGMGGTLVAAARKSSNKE